MYRSTAEDTQPQRSCFSQQNFLPRLPVTVRHFLPSTSLHTIVTILHENGTGKHRSLKSGLDYFQENTPRTIKAKMFDNVE